MQLRILNINFFFFLISRTIILVYLRDRIRIGIFIGWFTCILFRFFCYSSFSLKTRTRQFPTIHCILYSYNIKENISFLAYKNINLNESSRTLLIKKLDSNDSFSIKLCLNKRYFKYYRVRKNSLGDKFELVST